MRDFYISIVLAVSGTIIALWYYFKGRVDSEKILLEKIENESQKLQKEFLKKEAELEEETDNVISNFPDSWDEYMRRKTSGASDEKD